MLLLLLMLFKTFWGGILSIYEEILQSKYTIELHIKDPLLALCILFWEIVKLYEVENVEFVQKF